jgi:hypothetical protein
MSLWLIVTGVGIFAFLVVELVAVMGVVGSPERLETLFRFRGLEMEVMLRGVVEEAVRLTRLESEGMVVFEDGGLVVVTSDAFGVSRGVSVGLIECIVS